MDLLITGGKLVTMNAKREVFNGDILVTDGRIAKIGAKLKAPRGAKTIDAEGAAVVPGLIQTHVHVCQTMFRCMADDMTLLEWLRKRIWPFEGAHDANSLRASAEVGVAELLRGGTTTILDMGTVRNQDVVFEVFAESGIRGIGGKAMMDVPKGLPKGLQEGMRESLEESARLARTWHGAKDGRIKYAYCPRFALSCSEHLMREVAVRAREGGMLIHSHAAENRDEVMEVKVRTGMTNLSYLNSMGLTGNMVCLAHCVHIDENEMILIRETDTRVVHCPTSNLKLASGYAPVPELLSHGVSVSIGSDGAACNNTLDQWAEMRLAAIMHKPRCGADVMKPVTVFEMATIGGAKALGMDHEIGSLDVGKFADIAIVSWDEPHCGPGGDVYSRLVYATNASDVATVLVQGEVVMQNRKLTKLDEKRARARAEEELKKLQKRV
ncbi:MAG: 5'-deoxyadenosine deaminase [Deltaproteobacteria bacterium]|nr:5'-deoxyadenosine deaminase [Deltaproteobacteria bacterium]